MTPHEIELVVEAALTQLLPRLNAEPVLWTLATASERTGLSTRRLTHLFHSGAISGMWSAGRGRGSILLKPESVLAWIDSQVDEAALLAPSRRVKEAAAR